MTTAHPGDLLTLPQVAEFPLEWAVVNRAGADPARVLVVPADTHPAAGSSDVRIPSRGAGGPLILRCAYALWLPEGILGFGMQSGRLDPRDLSRAQQRIDEVEAGEDGLGSPLGRETDSDPEYLAWIAETVAPAAEALDAARARWEAAAGGAAPASRRARLPVPLPWLAAAALLVLSLGLTWKTIYLRHDLERLSQPVFNSPSGEVQLYGPTRGFGAPPVKVLVPADAASILLRFQLGSELPPGSGRLVLQTIAGGTVWTSPRFTIRSCEIPLLVSRSLLPEGRYRVVLNREVGGRDQLVQSQDLDILPAP